MQTGVPVLLCVGLLAGCGQRPPAPVAAAPQLMINTDDLVGNWGLASYRVETDRTRAEKAARAACSHPHIVTPGTHGGVMMDVADRSAPREVIVKTAADGSVYIGPPGRAGDPGDRRVISYDNGVIVTRWVDPDAARRYGTMVLAPCGHA